MSKPRLNKPKPEVHTDHDERTYVHVHHGAYNGCLWVSRRHGEGQLTLNKRADHAHAIKSDEMPTIRRWLTHEILPTVGVMDILPVPCDCRIHLTTQQLKCIGIK